MKPNKGNFCGGAFSDWLEVMLISRCNGTCSWCVEKNGYRPKEVVDWFKLAQIIGLSGYKNIILLGGEPTLEPYLGQLIASIRSFDKNVYLTTNGSMLTPHYTEEHLSGLTGINISIHDSKLKQNFFITGINLSDENLRQSIATLKGNGTKVRFNCNLIRYYIHDKATIEEYIRYAKWLGADSVRFAELKHDDENFVNLCDIYLNGEHGLINDPFKFGCNKNTVINEMSVNFRLMCGLQTDRRTTPCNPEQAQKRVLYYDGKFYDGWQTIKKEEVVEDKELVKILQEVEAGTKTASEGALEIGRLQGTVKEVVTHESSGGCQY